ncbi:MAG: response regulator [Lachnospiraceae bacterium]|nr:response regulator [Lachnospiraceae bacterium]
MLPFRTNIIIFIIEFLCTVLLQIVYGASVYGWEVAGMVAIGLLPVLLVSLISLNIDNESVVIRCLYISGIATFYYMSYALHTQGTLSFFFLALGVTMTLFIRPQVIVEYFGITTAILVYMVFSESKIIEEFFDRQLYVTFLTMYAFAGVTIFFVVNSVKRYQMEMEEKNEIAREALEAKSNFLANMSHEIRTPMNAIYGMAELLEERDFDKKEKEYIATIKRSSENLLSIINEILDFSKVEAGLMRIAAEPYQFNSMVQDVITIIEFRVKDKLIQLECNIDRNIPRELIGDEIRIKQILINILNNAVKFTNQGTVTLTINWRGGNVSVDHGEDLGVLCISVKDTGIGISEDDLTKLFTAFGQINTKKNRNVEGTGLGLAICKELTDAMGGVIRVDSVLKQGSTFYVELPQKVADPLPCNFIRDEDTIYMPTRDFQIDFIAPTAKVLIVDDNKVNRQVAWELMKLFGFEATLAESGEEAIDRVKKHLISYDLIFMDHMMPFMDGVEATQNIRQLPGEYARKVPIVALTANAINGVEQQFIDAGMNDYIAKPVKIEELQKLLQKWLPRHKQFPVGTSLEEIEDICNKQEERDWKRMSADMILEHLDGIDTDTGINNCAGSQSVYFEVLQTFATSNLANVLNMYFEKEDLENYSVTAHSIKGACKNIGAHDIADKAYSLERAGKRGDIAFIWDHHEEMVEEYTAMIKMLKKIFFGNL